MLPSATNSMTQRRILRTEKGQIVVLREGQFESEQVLHDAVAAHPDVLPVEDIGLDPLVTIASEVSVEGGFIDLLATDRLGRLAIVEFKKGTENPDARHVVAQLPALIALLRRRADSCTSATQTTASTPVLSA